MALKRPTSLLVFGILHITFGCLGLLFGIIGVVLLLTGFQKNMQQMQNPPAGATAQQKELNEFQVRMQNAVDNTPFYNEQQIATQVVNLVICVILIVGGIGLIKVAPWGRSVSLFYAVFSILSTICEAIYAICVSLPAMNAFFEQEKALKGDPIIGMTISISQMAMYAAPCFMVFYFIYPVLVLCWMLRPSIADVFRKGGIEVPDAEPYPPDIMGGVADEDDRRWGDRSGQTTEEYTPEKPQRSDMTTEEFYPDKPPPN